MLVIWLLLCLFRPPIEAFELPVDFKLTRCAGLEFWQRISFPITPIEHFINGAKALEFEENDRNTVTWKRSQKTAGISESAKRAPPSAGLWK